jgi:hypothetical protein
MNPSNITFRNSTNRKKYNTGNRTYNNISDSSSSDNSKTIAIGVGAGVLGLGALLTAERLYKGRNLGDAIVADVEINDDVGVNINELNPLSYENSQRRERQEIFGTADSIKRTIERANMPVPEYVEDELEV